MGFVFNILLSKNIPLFCSLKIFVYFFAVVFFVDCEEDLVKAEPALAAAQEALNTLNKNNLTELKSFGSPPGAVTNVTAAVMVLMAQNGKIPKDRSWKQAKMMMAKVDAFLDALINYDKEHIHSDVIKVCCCCVVCTRHSVDYRIN